MTDTKIEKTSELKEHSFEKVLGVPSGTTEMTQIKAESQTKPHEAYDHKDDEIENDFLKIYDKAIEMFEYLMAEMDDADPSKRSRMAEVANQTLNTALSAANHRRGLKQHIDILKQKERAINKKAHGSGGGTKIQNAFFGSHDQLMDMLKDEESKESKVIDSTEYDNLETDQ